MKKSHKCNIFSKKELNQSSNSNSIKSYKQIINQEENKEDININQETPQQQQPKQIVYDYNLNFPKQEKGNLISLNELQKLKSSQNEETPQGNYINLSQSYEVSQSGNNNINIINNPASDSIVINSKSYNFSNSHINNLISNYNMQQKKRNI
jgi:hypothetical protein